MVVRRARVTVLSGMVFPVGQAAASFTKSALLLLSEDRFVNADRTEADGRLPRPTVNTYRGRQSEDDRG